MAERILVVDDDLDSLKLIGLMLQRNGFDVTAANTGNQALLRASTERPDLIILDVMMPDMNGYEVCRRLRLNSETKAIPIIMFTAKTLIDDKVAGFEAGADDYLTKPTHPAELTSRVKTILARTAQRRTESSIGAAIGIIGVKGGLGTSTLALNLAAAHVLAGQNAVVADFRPGAGTIGLALGAPQSNGMMQLLTKTSAEIKPKGVEAELYQHTSGLRGLVCSPKARDAQLHIGTDTTIAVLRSLKQIARLSILDLGCGYNIHLSNIQPELNLLIVLTDGYPTTLSMLRELLREIDAGGNDKRIRLVGMNRSGALPQSWWTEIERMVGLPVSTTLAAASDLLLQAHQAHVPPVVFQPASMFSTQVIKLAEEMTTALNQGTHPEVAP